MGFLVAIQAIFIASKLVGVFPWSWGMVFMPAFLGLCVGCIQLLVAFWFEGRENR